MKIVSTVNLIGILGIVCYLFYNKTNEKKVVFINNGELFSSFKMTAESNEKVKQFELSRQNVLDSLINEIKLLNEEKDKKVIDEIKNNYILKRKNFSEEITRVKQSTNEKIATQINQYVKEFSEENKYDVVLGANGSGNIWHATENMDVTKDLIDFANKKYDGK